MGGEALLCADIGSDGGCRGGELLPHHSSESAVLVDDSGWNTADPDADLHRADIQRPAHHEDYEHALGELLGGRSSWDGGRCRTPLFLLQIVLIRHRSLLS